MLRTLLADRFKLRTHIESKQTPVYALMMAHADGRSGERLRKSPVDCRAVNAMLLKGERPAKPTCGLSQYPGRIVASAVTLPQLASVLSRVMNRPVADQTGLTGNFDVELEAVEITATGPFGPSYRPSDTKTSIFTALQDQLGLKLESTTGAIEIIVIDHAEKLKVEAAASARVNSADLASK